MLALSVPSSMASDWPQLQHDAARLGRTRDTVKPPYRARWIWFGSDSILRNRDSKPGGPDWKHDLKSEEGKNYPLERWVKDTPPDKLASYLRSVPTGIGDAYWIEGLVQTIEAFGTVK